MNSLTRDGVRYLPVCWHCGRDGMLFWGSVMLAMGVIALLTQFRLLPDVVYDLIGPGILIALGGWVLLGANGTRQEHRLDARRPERS